MHRDRPDRIVDLERLLHEETARADEDAGHDDDPGQDQAGQQGGQQEQLDAGDEGAVGGEQFAGGPTPAQGTDRDEIIGEQDEAEAAALRRVAAEQGCLRCHSLNLQEGDVGPEPNVPKSVTEYWDENVLVQFIKNPGDFRARSKMPPSPQLNDPEIQDLLSYLRWIRERKRPS